VGVIAFGLNTWFRGSRTATSGTPGSEKSAEDREYRALALSAASLKSSFWFPPE